MNEVQTIADIINQEGKALCDIASKVAPSIGQAADVLAKVKGHIIVAGIGKAGLIGQKISATLSSLSLPSFFMHPTEACHGDLGMASADDGFIVLSNSGTTDEMLQLLPLLKRTGCPVISITGKDNTPLTKHANAAIVMGDLAEVCPMRLAPTTSTTAMLAVGDALAIVLSQRKNITPEKYAKAHPGGALGKKLMTCNEIMRPVERLACAAIADSVRDVLVNISTHKAGSACVLDDKGMLLGIFTDGDLRRHLQGTESIDQQVVGNLMTKNPKSITPSQLAAEALALMRQYEIDEIPVVENNKLVGLIDIQDLVLMGIA